MAPRPSAIPETSEMLEEVVQTPVDTASLEQLPSSPADKTPTVDEVSELYNETIQTFQYFIIRRRSLERNALLVLVEILSQQLLRWSFLFPFLNLILSYPG